MSTVVGRSGSARSDVEVRMRALQSSHEDLRLLVRQQHLALSRLQQSLVGVRFLCWSLGVVCSGMGLGGLVVAVQAYQGA